MSKEAMKLALGKIKSARDCHPNAVDTLLFEAEEILEEARAKPDFWEGYVPEPDKRQQALDKKAENARELGLDYEPVQQKPEFLDWYDNAHWGNEDFKEGCWRAWDAALAQRTWVHATTWRGLTDEEIKELYGDDDNFRMTNKYVVAFARAIEAKLRSKNEDRN